MSTPNPPTGPDHSAHSDQPTQSAHSAQPARTRHRRLLWIVVLALAGAAAALWGAGQVADGARTGTGTTTEPGDVVDALDAGEGVAGGAGGGQVWTALALVAVAGVAGAVATGGPLRRAVGALLALTGGVALWLGVLGSTGAARELPGTGRVLVAGAGLLLVAAAVVLIWRAGRLPRLGARYQAAGARRSADQDGDLWDQISRGEDPTTQ